MADGCSDCLRAQLGWGDEADYPLDPTLEAPQEIFCVDGIPVVPPHKGLQGPFFGSIVVEPPTLSGTPIALPGVVTPINYVNHTARTVNLLIEVSGAIIMSTVIAHTFTFTYGYTAMTSGGGLSHLPTAQIQADGIYTISIGFPGATVLSIPAGGFADITPEINYAVSGGGPGSASLISANLTITMFGGAT